MDLVANQALTPCQLMLPAGFPTKLYSPRPRWVEKADNLDCPTFFIRQVGTVAEPLLSLVNLI